ncbi:hypothetical protein F7734_13280 [Scytonema sp. UIC 10036]|uniref:hypothetical protein n=1 Tax=Scytonema sp. UIC 10036 TaxID=2304196 RepID=UPI0012DA7E2E|nr:hypothetical protein [Scytonema sp. UIC 10036]MUG93345.1 hypothetical protein [Scytonema sp. UIC 10036]
MNRKDAKDKKKEEKKNGNLIVRRESILQGLSVKIRKYVGWVEERNPTIIFESYRNEVLPPNEIEFF